MSDGRSADSSPVILVGRGGSGTRLVSEMAQSIGVFLGNRLNVSFDSLEWVPDLYALALQSLAGEVVEGTASDREWRKRLRARAADILAEGQIEPDRPWGWKLPETIMCLPQVLRAFPKARVVHLVRHPLTSAWRRSHVTSRTDSAIGRAVMTAAYRRYDFDPADIENDEVWFHNAITWRFQVERAMEILAARHPTRYMVLKYERLCAAPETCCLALGQFLDLPTKSVGAGLPIDLARSGLDRPDAATEQKIWDLCGDVAAALGYSRDITA